MQCKTNTLTANKGTLRYQTWKESEYSPLNLSGKPFFQVTRQKVRQLTSSTSLSSIYPSVSCLYELSFCLALSARLAHTSFPPTFTHPFTSLSAFLLPTSNFLAFSSSRVFLISTNHCRLLSLSPSVSILLSLCSSPAGHFCPVHSLWENNSLWRAGGGVDPMGRVELLWSRSHYQLRGRAGMDKGEEGEAAGVERWVEEYSYEWTACEHPFPSEVNYSQMAKNTNIFTYFLQTHMTGLYKHTPNVT